MGNMKETALEMIESMNIKETSNKITFTAKGFNFWVAKKRGFIRKKIPARNFMIFANDSIGLSEGKYDGIIDNLMELVFLDLGEKEDPLCFKDGGFWEWADALEDDAVEFILHNFPSMVALAIMGKEKVTGAPRHQQTTASGKSTKKQEESSTTTTNNTELKQKQPKPVRSSPKIKQSS